MSNNGLFAYTDESGNSGLNLFDNGQPYFWTGTVISAEDLQIKADELIQFCTQKLNVEELHANELGFGKIELIADELIQFIKENNLRFVFTRVSKEHFANVKFVDTVIDSEYNRAVSPLHYSNKFFRLMFTYHLTLGLRPGDSKKFWKVYGNGNVSQFIEVLNNVKQHLNRTCPDPRLRLLLSDAIQFASDYPERFLENRKSEMDSPNVTAFFSVLNALNEVYHQTGLQIKAFIHDEQNQFAKYFYEFYKYMKDIKIRNNEYPYNNSIEKVNVLINDELLIRKSENSHGLQIVDIALWIMKKHLDHPDRQIRNKCKNLLNAIILNGTVVEFTQEQLERDLITMNKEIMDLPLTQQQLENGKNAVKDIEGLRLDRINRFSIN